MSTLTRHLGACTAASVLVTLVPLASHAATVGQSDTFQDGSLQGWQIGKGTPPTNSTEGSGGATDRYLRVTSIGGSGENSKMVVFNTAQWAGSYTSGTITRLDIRMANLTPTPSTTLFMRIAIIGAAGEYVSTTPLLLPADGVWRSASFPLDITSLTKLSGGTLADTLASVSELRVLSLAGPALDKRGDAVAATLGIDNVTAVPEPSATAIAGMLSGGLLVRRSRRSTRAQV
jgi:hypothetical protein